jgi:hypothetical protein
LLGIVTVALLVAALGRARHTRDEEQRPPVTEDAIDGSLVKVTKLTVDSKDPQGAKLSLIAGTRVALRVDAEMDCEGWRLQIPGRKKTRPSSVDDPLPSFEVYFVRHSLAPSGEESFATGGSKPKAVDAKHIRWDGKALVPLVPGGWRVRLVFVKVTGPPNDLEYVRTTVAAFDVDVEGKLKNANRSPR